jgi:membrane protease YdiL (CAAX protease family)
MAPPAWDVFVVGSVTLVVGVLVLARQSASLLGASDGPLADLSRWSLYLNVAVSHGLILALFAVLLWWTAVPIGALGIEATPDWRWLVGLAVLLVGLNEAADRVARAVGSADNPLRDRLTPESGTEWAALAGLVLPVIAVTEEVLFRGLLIGAFGVGTPIPPVALIVGAAVAFGLAHTAQGRLGVGVATLLGLVLGGVYYWSGSLWLVIGAHYVVDLVEFVRHAGDDLTAPRVR